MEEFSRAYVIAIAARAGYQLARPPVDDDSIDGVIMGREGRRPRIEFQLKATGQDLLGDQHIDFPLPIKNYDELRADVIVPRILIVLLMPSDEGCWLMHSEEALSLRRCAYWDVLYGRPEVGNTSSVTVHIPRAQRFTAEALGIMMRKVGAGEWP